MHIDTEAHREKSGAALNSLFAAVFLTGIKLVVGLSTNSLGILSEAMHSGLDLLAAGVTYFAVRYSSLPADNRHPYGHGKIENLSALIETLLLLVTCVFIVREAVDRLFYHPEAVEVTWWSFGVMAVSIVVDLTRSRMLKKMAEKHNSQALEADALHFSTDVWSSAVVIVGLVSVAGAGLFLAPGSFWRSLLERADAVAALGVCAIVVWVSVQLGRRAVDALLDGGSEDTADAVRAAVQSLPGVRGISHVRARFSGPSAFVDLTVDIPRQTSFEQAHAIGARAEEAVRGVVPGADVVVHLEPVAGDDRDLFESVRGTAARHGLPVHGLQAHQTRAGLHLEMHVEVPDDLSLAEAHRLVSALEADLKAGHKQPLSVASHIEPVGEAALVRDSTRDESRRICDRIQGLVSGVEGVQDCHGVVVHRADGWYSVSFHCRMDPGTPIGLAHATSAHLEDLVRGAIADVGRVVIHVEPLTAGSPPEDQPGGHPNEP